MEVKLYKINDVVSNEFIRLPLALLANGAYKSMSLEAKVVYSLLLNRLTLSQRNGWLNENNEVYLIYTREDAANSLSISYKKSIAAFKELISNNLIVEKRRGRGLPNIIYIAKTDLNEQDASSFAEKFSEIETEEELDCFSGTSRTVDLAYQETPKQHIKNCRFGISRNAETAYQEVQ